MRHLVEVISTSKSIQIQRIPSKSNANQTTNVTCTSTTDLSTLDCIDPKNYMRFGTYCIPNYLFKEFLNYKQFKVASTSLIAFNDLFENMEFFIFFCQTMKMTEHCEHVANLCVLTVYNLDKFSPCNIFYTMQTTLINAGVDAYQTKLVPFLFYAKGRSVSDDLDKIIDFRYKYGKSMDYDTEEYGDFGQYKVRFFNCFVSFNFIFNDIFFPQLTNRISLMMVAHELNGDLRKIQPVKLNDLNLCGSSQQSIHFGENLASACQLDLRTLIEIGEQRPWFLNLYLNYTENNLHLIKSIPILIRNAFTYNMVRPWILVPNEQYFLNFFSTESL